MEKVWDGKIVLIDTGTQQLVGIQRKGQTVVGNLPTPRFRITNNIKLRQPLN